MDARKRQSGYIAIVCIILFVVLLLLIAAFGSP